MCIQGLLTSTESTMAIKLQDHSDLCSSSTEQLTGTKSSSNCMISFQNVLKSVTLEPVIFITAIAISLTGIYTSSLLMYKICRVEFKNDSEICHNLTSYPHLEAEVQKVATTYQIYFTILETLPPLIIIIFLGPWSDKYGRKWPLSLQLATYTISTIIPILVYEFEELSPLLLLAMPAITSLTGSFVGANIIFNSYLSDISDEKSRTMRLSIMNGFFYIASPIGTLSAGYILKNWGYTGVFSVGLFLDFLGLFYTIFVIKESLQLKSEHQNDSFCVKLKNFFNYKSCIESFRTFFKKRAGNKRRRLWILTVCKCLTNFATTGGIFYLYARLKFSWTDQLFSYYITYYALICCFASVVLLAFLIKFAKVKDHYLFLLGLFGVFMESIIIAFSTASWMLFIAPLVLVNEYVYSPIRSLLIQCVEPNEVAQLFSILAIFECAIPTISSTLYSRIYNATLTVFPGTVFLVSNGFITLCIFIMCYVIYDIITSDTYDNSIIAENSCYNPAITDNEQQVNAKSVA